MDHGGSWDVRMVLDCRRLGSVSCIFPWAFVEFRECSVVVIISWAAETMENFVPPLSVSKT